MSDLLFWMMAYLGRRGTAILLTILALLAFVVFVIFIVLFATRFPEIALGAVIIIGLLALFSQFIFAVAEAIEEQLPERKSKDELSD